MKKIFIMILILTFTQSITLADTYKTFTPIQDNVNTFNYYNSQNNYQNVNKTNTNYNYDEYPKITQIEGLLFNKTYEKEDITQRLNRIEQKMFRKTNSNLDLYTRSEIITQNIDPGLMYNIPTKDLANIETKLIGKSFPNDDIETRIIRLEKEMLGAMQDGDLGERYEVVAQAAKHYNAYPYVTSNSAGPRSSQNNYYQDYDHTQYTQPYHDQQSGSYNTGGGFKAFFNNALSAMTGCGVMTGFTPPIGPPGQYGYYDPMYDQLNPMESNYPPSGSGTDRYIRTRNGYYHSNDSYGSGSGVRVMYD